MTVVMMRLRGGGSKNAPLDFIHVGHEDGTRRLYHEGVTNGELAILLATCANKRTLLRER